MKTIHVLSAFQLLLAGGRKIDVPAGIQTVEDEVADHWFTQGFLAHGGLGTVEYAESTWGSVNTAWARALEARDAYLALASASAEADAAAGLPERELPHVAWGKAEGERVIQPEPQPKPEPELVAEETPPADNPPAPNDPPLASAETDPLDRDHDGRRGGDLPDGYRWSTPEERGEGQEFIVGPDGQRAAESAEELRALLADQESNPESPKAPDYDAMDDDVLRALIIERDGKAPNGRMGHDKLVALAKNAPHADPADEG